MSAVALAARRMMDLKVSLMSSNARPLVVLAECIDIDRINGDRINGEASLVQRREIKFS